MTASSIRLLGIWHPGCLETRTDIYKALWTDSESTRSLIPSGHSQNLVRKIRSHVRTPSSLVAFHIHSAGVTPDWDLPFISTKEFSQSSVLFPRKH